MEVHNIPGLEEDVVQVILYPHFDWPYHFLNFHFLY